MQSRFCRWKTLEIKLLEYLSEGVRDLAAVNLYYILLALGLYYLSVLLYALRLQLVLRKIGIDIGIRDAVAAHMLTIVVNNLTPSAKTGGELARAAYVYFKTKAPLVNIFTAIAFERLSEAFPVIAMAIVGLYMALMSGNLTIYVIAAAVLPIVGIYFGVRYWDKLMNYAIEKMAERGIQLLDGDAEIASLREMVSDKKTLAISIAISSFVWILDVLRLYVIGLSVDWKAPFLKFILLSIGYLAVSLFAITPGGLGIVEGGLTALLVALGAPPNKAVTIMIMERLISYATATLLGGLVATVTGGWHAWKHLRSRWRQTGSIQK